MPEKRIKLKGHSCTCNNCNYTLIVAEREQELDVIFCPKCGSWLVCASEPDSEVYGEQYDYKQ